MQRGETPFRCTHVASEATRDVVGLGNPLALDKTRLEARLGAIEIDALKEDNVIMHMHEKHSTTPCRPP